MRNEWMLFGWFFAVAVLTGCGSDQVVGCTSDDHCRGTRVCFLETHSCVETVPPGTTTTTSDRVTVNDIKDPPAEVVGAPTASTGDFLGTWNLLANGSLETHDGGGMTSFQYDEEWAVTIATGTDHDLALRFDVTTAPGLTGCDSRGDLSGAGFVFTGGPCRADGSEIDAFGGAGYFDRFGKLTIVVRGESKQLATGYLYVLDFTTSGSLGTP